MAKALYLLRHGSTGLDGRFVGSTDLPVVPSALKTVQRSGESLQGKAIEKVFCSPMLRCRQSFERLNLDGTAEFVDDLREIDFGEWEEKSFHEVTESHPETVAEWAEWSEKFAFPGGESMQSFLGRVQSVREKVEISPAGSILIVSHGGIIRQLICSLLGLPPSSYLLFDIKAGFYSTMHLYSKGGVLTGLNAQ